MTKVKTLQELANEVNALIAQGKGELKVSLYDRTTGNDAPLFLQPEVNQTGETELPVSLFPEDEFICIRFDSSWRTGDE